MKVFKLRTNHIQNPLGFDLTRLSLSWLTESTVSTYQEAAQVEIALDATFDEIIFDSGKSKEIDSLSYSPNLTLQPRTRYYWRVMVWGNEGEMAISDHAWFETGKMEEAWEGKWITPELEKDTHPLIRKNFTVSDEIVSARAYLCGLGIYHFELNGQKVGEEYFAPGFNAYDFWLQYQTYDVTDLIKNGENSIGVMIGNGWYKGRFGFDGGYYNLYGDKFALIGEIIVTYKDGSETIIKTDEGWKSASAPVTFSGIYDGEVYDANKEISGWSQPSFDDHSWQGTTLTKVESERLQARLSLPVKIMEERKPIDVIHTPAGETVLDMGQVMTGWVRFKTNASKGATLNLQYGEILQDGCFYRENLRTAKAEYTYISDGSEREVQPYFTFYGFRYVKLSGFEGDINLDDFVGCVIYSEIEETGNIETSHPLVNKLFQNAYWGQKGNFLDVPTDCPQRDERMGWTGDAQIFSSTACFNMYSPAFFHKFMFDLREEQKRLEGSVPFIVPTIKPENDPGFVTGHGSSVWGDAATVIPWTLYMHYGDKELLREHFKTMKDWVDFIKRQDDETGSTRLWQKGFHFGDWLALDGRDPNGMMGGTDSFYIASAYYSYSASLVAKAANVLGLTEIAKEYKTLSDEVKEAINKEYFTPNGRSAIHTQTAMIVALEMDLVSSDYRHRLIKDLKDKLGQDNMHLNTGFVGTPYFCNVLSENGAADYAYTLLLNEDYPSWLYAVKLGATTIWERWNSVLPDGKISGTGMNSLNHYAYGSIAEWMYRHMCGINLSEDIPGFKKIIFNPKPDGRLSYVKATLHSACGRIESGWEITQENELRFTFKVPFNSLADVVLPVANDETVTLNGQNLSGSSFKTEEDHEQVLIKGLPMGTYEIVTSAMNYVYPFSVANKLRELLETEDTKKQVFTVFPEFEHNPFIRQHSEKEFKELSQLPITSHFVNEEKLHQLDQLLKNVRIQQYPN
ncbi:glycoside hydrolase family 78 protein [Alkalihalobacillus sp. MEB130]|uniref:alpha-L-rhamnosidase n=1 Tax=Alkalihalobacillus sp. MEB130 TaxID=2976704 RepID=UPI0028DE3C35|nr:family 78 glycoside hydrolase catalytic domain [Alkalihalobacillus sp. MEB130]MDT8861815.1 glycoside hydrolase family 78 protein [Alkalihalobacillus sp. MEB130]